MLWPIQSAVAACALPTLGMQLCRAVADCRVELHCMAGDGASAMEALRAHRPDLLLADQQLPVLDGSALARRALLGRDLPRRPRCILLCDSEFMPPGAAELRDLGALLLEKPVSGAALAAAIRSLEAAPPRFSPRESMRAEQLLSDLGVPDHPGRQCLKAAALLAAGDASYQRSLLGRLYPAAGEICGMTAKQAERAMRHAIGLAWQSNQFENQYRIFADTVDAGRGQPTCGEMISRLADILRLEG